MATKKKNFTENERNLLIQIVKPYSDIIENKKTDSVSIAQKKEAWTKISENFNASTLICEIASGDQLKRLWQNIKHRQIDAITKERQYRLATGGGGPCPSIFIDPDVADIAPALLVEITDVLDSDAPSQAPLIISQEIATPPSQPLPPQIHPSSTNIEPECEITPQVSSQFQYSKIEKKLKAQILLKEHLKRIRRCDEDHELKLKLLKEQLKYTLEENELKNKMLKEQLREAKARADLAEIKLKQMSNST